MRLEKFLPVITQISRLLPKRHLVQARDEELSCRPFFILSSGRSGTTLLAALLDQHSQLLVPPEQFVLANTIVKYRLYNYLEWLDLVSIIVGEFSRTSATMEWNLNAGEIIEELFRLPKNQRSLRVILDHIYTAYGKQHGFSFTTWGDKSPKNTDYFKYIFPVFPDARFIALIRDGRDVAASIFKKNEQADTRYVLRKWNYSLKMIEMVRRKTSEDSFLLVKYEDLVSEPEKTLDIICRFLDVNPEPVLDKQAEYLEKMGSRGKMKAFENLKNPVSTASVGKWETDLPQYYRQVILRGMEKNLRKYGYIK